MWMRSIDANYEEKAIYLLKKKKKCINTDVRIHLVVVTCINKENVMCSLKGTIVKVV